MPLGFERINERVQRPNKLINFIRTLPGSTSTYAQDFLERIAAISYPIMKANNIAVQALEEYEWNREFIGRNFNAGEVIQLVLRSKSGAWMPFKHVQMVMMHELAHCKQMNHSKAFWKVRDGYCDELRSLWTRGYTGEGFWGAGRNVERGDWVNDIMPDTVDLPEHTCGGTFRSSGRGRKRKRGNVDKPKVSYAERQQRRILKKFGTGGVSLGDDEASRAKLEEGKKRPKGKPRVASSARGRDLRAAAALARFDQAKEEEFTKVEDSETDSDEEYNWPLTDDEAVLNQDGKKIVDEKGHEMVRVCDAEDEDDVDVKREMQELFDMDQIPTSVKNKRSSPSYHGNSISEKADEELPELSSLLRSNTTNSKSNTMKNTARVPTGTTIDTNKSEAPDFITNIPPSKRAAERNSKEGKSRDPSTATNSESVRLKPTRNPKEASRPKTTSSSSITKSSSSKPMSFTADTTASAVCQCCSYANEPKALTCFACSNVLNTRVMHNHWRCQSLACRGGTYVNMGDFGICQLCGARKP